MFNDSRSSFILGAFIFAGLSAMGWLIGSSAIRFREYERVVSVKGLSEREEPADVAVWPIHFTSANNDLTALYATMEGNAKQVSDFLVAAGFTPSEITAGAPAITDRLAQQYGNNERVQLRYIANQTVTVYSGKIDLVRTSQNNLVELGKKGIAFGGGEYQQTQYLFTKLNDVKPAMIEEATRKAREVAEKFASDSKSRLGKIKGANQGQFSVEDRDSNTPYVKKVRVVSTVDYYLSD
jgi:uncharacterized protein